MSYTAAVRDFLRCNNASEGILIIQPDGSWAHIPSGYSFHLARYAAVDYPATALIEAADDLDQVKGTSLGSEGD